MQVCKEDLVISGVSGRFPLSRSVDEFADNLLQGVDMVTEDDKRWPPGLYGLPRRHGKLDDIDKFDAQFFGVCGKHAETMDPQVRLLQEVAYEAICDSGVNPANLRGSSIGVFINSSSSDTNSALFGDFDPATKYSLLGTPGSMLANRISYSLDLKGPSMTVDTACASSLSAVDLAFHAIRSGQCDAAIAGGANLCLNPGVAIKYNSMSMISPDGKCKAFDASADGFVRSEACAVIFIQKVSTAKRIYAKIINIRSNSDGYKAEGITFPSIEMQTHLIKSTFEGCNLSPLAVNFVEAHGPGTVAGDPVEVNAIASVYCQGRDGPLLLGSTKSNMGHSEFTAALCSLVKVLIAFEKGIIPANLHLKTLNLNIEPLVNGSVKPVTENTKFTGSFAGINSFGFGGSNVHLIVQSCVKEQTVESNNVVPRTHPRLITMSGRTEEAVNTGLNFIKDHPIQVTREFLALLNDLSKTKPESGMKCRGFTLLGDDYAVMKFSRAEKKRPLWFILPGMGGQWTSMGRQLMQLPHFAQSIKEFALILAEKNVDLIHSLTTEDEQLLDNLVNRLVMVASVQGALIDLLYSLGVEADGFVGHSQGELACAYSDGCLSKRQFILSVYWRAKCCQILNLNGGMMATVSLSVDECKKRMPEEISIACYNSHQSLTVSGPEESVRGFLKQLEREDVFARELSSCGVAFHSRHVSSTRNHLLTELKKEISSPLKRSDKWMSSSLPESKWQDTDSQFASAEYFVNNFLSPVLFVEAVKQIPKDAILLEVSSDPLFKSVLHQSLGDDATHLCLMNKNKDNQMTHLFTSLGQLYNLGVNLNLEVLYPAVEYPVPRGTPSISSLMRWDHSQSWPVTKYPEYFNPSKSTGGMKTTIDLSEKSHEYLTGHMIDGRVLFPATGYIMLACQAFASVCNEVWTKIPVNISDLVLHRACILPVSGPVSLVTQVLPSTGEFSITEDDALLASGNIAPLSSDEKDLSIVKFDSAEQDTLFLSKEGIYKELRVRGYDYGPSFRGIERSTFDGSRAVLKWTGEWISFADALLQTFILSMEDRALNLPVRIKSIKFDPRVLLSLEQDSLVQSRFNSALGEISGGGLVIKGLSTSQASRRNAIHSLESYSFVPLIQDDVECKEVMDYMMSCSKVAFAILKQSKRSVEAASLNCDGNISAENIEDIYRSVKDSKDQILLKCLGELFTVYSINEKNFNDTVAVVQQRYQHELSKDLLQQSFTSELTLRPLIHLVAENTSKEKLDILEFNSSGNHFAPSVAHFAQLHWKTVNYSLVGDDGKNASNVNLLDWQEGSYLSLPRQDLVIYHQSLETRDDEQDKLFTQICSLVSEGGFLLLGGRTNFTEVEKAIFGWQDNECHLKELTAAAETMNLTVVSMVKNRVGMCLILLRKEKEQASRRDNISIIGVNSSNFSWLEDLKAAMKDREEYPEKGNIWLISSDGPRSGLIGLVNCIRLEPAGDKIRCIVDKSLQSIDEIKSYTIEDKLLKLDLATNVIDENNNLGSYCHLNISAMEEMVHSEHAYLHCTTEGDPSSLRWIERKLEMTLPVKGSRESELIYIYYSALNFRDLMLVTGKLELPKNSSQNTIGLEVSGRKSTGERVMGFIHGSGIATTCMMDNTFFWPVPDEWSLEEAATVPIVYTTSYYALIVRGSLQPGESVLIHSGAGGVGLAAISICLAMGCQVFVTVGLPSKKKYLLEEFPQLKQENIFNSHDLTFEKHVMAATNGRGVDLVLNSLTEEKLRASVRLVAENGRFIEIGKYDLMKDNALGMSVLLRNISIIGVCLGRLFSMTPSESSERQKNVLRQLMNEGIANGTVRPLRRTLFAREKAEDAFRFMMTGEHIGKILIQMRQEEPDKIHLPEPLNVMAMSRTFFHPNKSYIIIGGLGGFGLELAYWMATRGARNLILTSRSGVKDAYQTYCIKRLEKYGVTAIASTLDAGDSLQANKLLDEAIAVGPVGGIFNLALVLRDKLLVNQTEQSFEEVVHCKVAATINIDIASRLKCPQLDHFIVFSSAASSFGNAGQSNYALANSAMEMICEERCKVDLPALAIQWGMIADVGVLAEKISLREVVAHTLPQRINSCIGALDLIFASKATIIMSCVRCMNDADIEATSLASGDDLVSIVCRIVGLSDPSSISLTASLQELGMDSLMIIELKQTLARKFDLSIKPAEIRCLTLEKLLSITARSHPV